MNGFNVLAASEIARKRDVSLMNYAIDRRIQIMSRGGPFEPLGPAMQEVWDADAREWRDEGMTDISFEDMISGMAEPEDEVPF